MKPGVLLEDVDHNVHEVNDPPTVVPGGIDIGGARVLLQGFPQMGNQGMDVGGRRSRAQNEKIRVGHQFPHIQN